MKFLLVLPTDRLGGAERVAMNLVRLLAKNEHHIIYIHFLSLDKSLSWDEFNNFSNVNITYSYSSSVKFGILSFLNVAREIEDSIDYIYSTHAHVNILLCTLRRIGFLKCKKLILRESSILSTRYSGFKKRLIDIAYLPYGNQDLLICQTNLMREKIIEHRGLRISKNSIVIPNPLDFEKINTNLKFSNNIQHPSYFNVVMVGRLIEIKNHKLVLESLSNIKMNINFIVVGEGPLRNDLEDLANHCAKNIKVDFVGAVSNPYKYMKCADLGIISSFSEGFPNVLIEMMASGTKDIIITPCTGDLNLIPNITVTEGFSVYEMEQIITNKVNNPLDNSNVYKNYSLSRDVKSYWDCIKDAMEIK
ncbi:glycosyltransferase [Photobacterium phosphoreum]|uniref:glycosyltransferase n=1 Tax=Photobacterium phosphoreum TaxID=659 RepID=UPI001E4D433B|nr:glycosyltransferase [Photobacterium phosphoreum]MCD9504138.1 glycosyltransferase [Photobacterium phosphoreum]